jgi:hypothetical protein
MERITTTITTQSMLLKPGPQVTLHAKYLVKAYISAINAASHTMTMV